MVGGIAGRRPTAPRELALLAELLVHHGQPVTIDHVVDELPALSATRQPPHVIHTLVSRLRKRLADTGGPEAAGLLVTFGSSYLLRVDDETLDALLFDRLIGEARRACASAAAVGCAALTTALDLWRGAPLEDVCCESRCVEAERLRLEELRAEAVEERAELLLTMGAHAQVASDLMPQLQRHPLRERLSALLMLALYRAGRGADALAAYQATRARLAEDIGIDPGPQLRQLHERILRADPSLDVGGLSTATAARVALAVPVTPRARSTIAGSRPGLTRAGTTPRRLRVAPPTQRDQRSGRN